MNLFVIKNLLMETEITIDTALSGEECLDLLKKQNYDLILLDIRMPHMDGIETLKHIKDESLAENVPVIALTADALEGAKEKYLNLGFNGYLSKPVEPSVLETVLMGFLPENKIKPGVNMSGSVYKEELPDFVLKYVD